MSVARRWAEAGCCAGGGGREEWGGGATEIGGVLATEVRGVPYAEGREGDIACLSAFQARCPMTTSQTVPGKRTRCVHHWLLEDPAAGRIRGEHLAVGWGPPVLLFGLASVAASAGRGFPLAGRFVRRVR